MVEGKTQSVVANRDDGLVFDNMTADDLGLAMRWYFIIVSLQPQRI